MTELNDPWPDENHRCKLLVENLPNEHDNAELYLMVFLERYLRNNSVVEVNFLQNGALVLLQNSIYDKDIGILRSRISNEPYFEETKKHSVRLAHPRFNNSTRSQKIQSTVSSFAGGIGDRNEAEHKRSGFEEQLWVDEEWERKIKFLLTIPSVDNEEWLGSRISIYLLKFYEGNNALEMQFRKITADSQEVFVLFMNSISDDDFANLRGELGQHDFHYKSQKTGNFTQHHVDINRLQRTSRSKQSSAEYSPSADEFASSPIPRSESPEIGHRSNTNNGSTEENLEHHSPVERDKEGDPEEMEELLLRRWVASDADLEDDRNSRMEIDDHHHHHDDDEKRIVDQDQEGSLLVNLCPGISHDALTLYLETFCEDEELSNVVYSTDGRHARVPFENKAAIGKILSKNPHVICDQTVHLERYKPSEHGRYFNWSCGVLLKGIGEEQTDDGIGLHFEAEENGGSSVKVAFNRDRTMARITFEDCMVIEDILKKKHRICGKEFTLEEYQNDKHDDLFK